MTRRLGARVLAHARAATAIRIDEPEIAEPIGKICVWTADQHAIEDVKEFHPQFRAYMFAKVEVLGESKIFIGIERIA